MFSRLIRDTQAPDSKCIIIAERGSEDMATCGTFVFVVHSPPRGILARVSCKGTEARCDEFIVRADGST